IERADSYAFRTFSRRSSSCIARSKYGFTVVAASETLSFVLAILRGSFRLLARAVLPLAILFILAACGSSKSQTAKTTVEVRGPGFTFQVPKGWSVSTPRNAVVARQGSGLVSVTRFSLLKAYDPAK